MSKQYSILKDINKILGNLKKAYQIILFKLYFRTIFKLKAFYSKFFSLKAFAR
jgi:hypothetical protein